MAISLTYLLYNNKISDIVSSLEKAVPSYSALLHVRTAAHHKQAELSSGSACSFLYDIFYDPPLLHKGITMKKLAKAVNRFVFSEGSLQI